MTLRMANEDPIDGPDGTLLTRARYMVNLLEEHHPSLHWRIVKNMEGWNGGWWELQHASPADEDGVCLWKAWPWEFSAAEIKASDGPDEEGFELDAEEIEEIDGDDYLSFDKPQGSLLQENSKGSLGARREINRTVRLLTRTSLSWMAMA